ncbi:MAG: D-aminoacylase [Candidatus Lokiarchaeota archaeon]|nr:D-aminoacylase [Candidatus Lokiarchaeota archaeon]
MDFDIIIKNGRIIDGAGNPWHSGEIGVKDGKIVEINPKIKDDSKKVIDARGLIICPGFIDIHSHTDWILPGSRGQESTLYQGITTAVVGMCGEGMAPIPEGKEEDFLKLISKIDPILTQFEFPYHTFAEYLEYNEKKRNSANLVFFVGYGNLQWASGQGGENRPANPVELRKMKDNLREAMEAGAFGISTGLIYAPQVFAKTEEIIELAKVVAEYNGLYFSHIRGEGATVLKAVGEVIEIVEISGCAGGQIAHHKISGKPYWGTSKETLSLIEEANERGISITCDQYPYNRGMAGLMTALPPWVREGKNEDILDRIKNPEIQKRIKVEVTEGIEGFENWIRDEGFQNMYISTVTHDNWKDIISKNITEITKIKGFSDDFDTFFNLLIDNELSVMITIQSMGEDDIRRILTNPYQMVGTDGSGVPASFSAGAFHPRFFGTYPRILGKYVREEKVLPLEQAIRKMTSFPAQRLRLQDRGLIREGNWADLVIFDPDKVIDKATYEQPYQLPEGIPHVVVNGVIVVERGKKNRKAPGKVIHRPT